MPEPEQVFAPEPPPAEPDLFSMPATPAPEPAAPLEKPAQSLSRYATPVRQKPEYRIPPTLGRWAALAAGGIVVLALVFLGLRALYRATSPAPSAIDDAATNAATAVVTAEKRDAAPQKREAQPRKERTPQEIPSLYID